MRLRILVALVLGVVLAAGAVPARADIIPVLTSITPSSGGFLWTYTATVNVGQKLSPLGAVPGSATPVDNTRSIEDYLTLYDFGGFTGVVILPPAFGFESLMIGSTPQQVSPPFGDSPSIANVTIYRTLTTVEPPCCSLPGGSVFTFSIESTFGDIARTLGEFVSDATKDAPGDPSNNTDVSNAGFVESPFQARVPEPGTLLLVGAGLFGLGVYRRRIAG
jgi:hypothetical protein